jgi:Uma2 family endonuclease
MTVATDRQPLPALQALPKPITFDEFVAWYPEQSACYYELRRGVITEMPQPRGTHSQVGGKIAKKLNYAIDAAGQPYLIPTDCLIKLDEDNGYKPDVIILDESILGTEPCWQTASTIEQAASIKLVIEVVSTNWQDDYELKMAAYEALGIPEYWIIDYAGLGGIRHIGKPKQPTLTIAILIDGEYEISQFRGDEQVISQVFPDIQLTATQVLHVSE